LARTLIECNITPDYVLGASLGAFAAATIAGCLDMEEALKAVVQQAAMIETHCRKGGMIAVLADPTLHQHEPLRQACEIAAFNSAAHFVVAARQERLANVTDYLRRNDITFQCLPVSYAFHSQWIDEAQAPFESFLKTLSFKPAAIPIVCCKEAGVITRIPAFYFWTIAREPIQFVRTIHSMESRGTYRYIDAGPSGSMATFLKYLLPPRSASFVTTVMSPFQSDVKRLRAIQALPA